MFILHAANTRQPATTSSVFEFDFEMEFLEILATKCVEGRFNYVTVQANLVHTSYSSWLMTCIGIIYTQSTNFSMMK